MKKNGQKCLPVGLKIKVRNKIQKSALASHLFYEETDRKIPNARERRKFQKVAKNKIFADYLRKQDAQKGRPLVIRIKIANTKPKMTV